MNIRCAFVFTFFVFTSAVFCCRTNGAEQLSPGSQYKIIRPVYLMAVYNSLNNIKLSRETARAYLHANQYYNKSEVAFQSEVPVDTIMTIIGSAPKVWHIPFFAKRYFVKLNPDISRGLDIILELNRGIEGDLDGLNSDFFKKE